MIKHLPSLNPLIFSEIHTNKSRLIYNVWELKSNVCFLVNSLTFFWVALIRRKAKSLEALTNRKGRLDHLQVVFNLRIEGLSKYLCQQNFRLVSAAMNLIEQFLRKGRFLNVCWDTIKRTIMVSLLVRIQRWANRHISILARSFSRINQVALQSGLPITWYLNVKV